MVEGKLAARSAGLINPLTAFFYFCLPFPNPQHGFGLFLNFFSLLLKMSLSLLLKSDIFNLFCISHNLCLVQYSLPYEVILCS